MAQFLLLNTGQTLTTMKNLLIFHSSINQFQVDFARRTLLHSLATQGYKGTKVYWVKTYLVAFSFDGKYFEPVWDSSSKVPKVSTIIVQW